ncbi:MAG: hypothetical protein ACRDPZ_11690, partial [Gaiellaceae bacterium]
SRVLYQPSYLAEAPQCTRVWVPHRSRCLEVGFGPSGPAEAVSWGRRRRARGTMGSPAYR